MRLAVSLFGWILVAAPLPGQVVDSAVPIPMRDGVILRATVLRPKSEGRFPVLVYRTPYSQTAALAGYTTFTRAAARGYAVVAQDVRGRYLSDGEFDPYRQEGKDGYDTIEWAAAQPWSNGRVGTFGLSYPGAVQWLAAIETPPHLEAMVPAMTFSRPSNFWYTGGGVVDLSWPAWIWLNIAPDVRRKKGLAGPTTGTDARATWGKLGAEIVNRLPVTDVPELDSVAPWFRAWYTHPVDDPWWDWADLTSKYGGVKAAVLNLSAWHDDNYGPEGALTNHRGLTAARHGRLDPRSHLILGPWVHGVSGINDRTPTAKSGERVFGARAGLDYDEEILGFMDRYLGRVEPPPAPGPRVRVFLMGENIWLTANEWPLPGTRPTPLHLGPKGVLSWTPSRQADRRTITADPAKPIVDPFGDRSGAHDYRALSARADVLTYETAPLERAVRVVGTIEARLTIQTDAPSVDVWVKVLDVAPDGTAWNVMPAGLDVQRSAAPAGDDPDALRNLVLGTLMTGNSFRRGHCIRILVMTSFMPNFARNPQTGRSETVERATRSARFSVLSGPSTPSMLTLPIVP
jgi:putative CocE/NonD family hydrolase